MAYLKVGLARVGHYCTTWVRRRAYLTSLIEPIALFELICGLKPTTAKFIAWLPTQLYRETLARANIDLRRLPKAGSAENLALLLDPHSEVSVALIQGGIISAGDSSKLESLGTIFKEPLWWFHKREIRGEGVDGLRGQKVSIGSEGSGTRALALELLKRNSLENVPDFN